MSNPIKPYIPADQNIPEFTIQAVILGFILALVMCAANVYVGLYAGMTISAAIPASVISMGLLRGVLRRGTILENNVVHTFAGAGESLAAGIIFTVPAIVLLGLWDTFHFWETTLIAMAGGVMGIVMMIPLRKPMIIEQTELKYPEGVACAEVLKAGDRGGAEMAGIFAALGMGALFKIAVSVLGVFKGTMEWGIRIGKGAFAFGSDVSPMLLAVGFIVGFEASTVLMVGNVISNIFAIPALSWGTDFTQTPALDVVGDVWNTQIRYLGIGAMVVAGVYSIIKISGSMSSAIKTSWRGIRGLEDTASLPRNEQGISGKLLFSLLLGSMILSGIVYYMMTKSMLTTGVITVLLFILAFFFVAVASYIVGLVGSSNSPVSGMTICTVLITAGLFLIMGYTGPAGMLATLGVAGVVCCAACTSGDICQDLKIGQIVGATPKKFQIAEILGAVSAAFIIAPTMTLLHKAYGIGTAARAGVPPLKAPQGVMFQKLVGGLFGAEAQIPWNLVLVGALICVIAIIIDRYVLAPRNGKFRLYPMPLAVGMYLPMSVILPMFIGGVVYEVVAHRLKKKGLSEEEQQAGVHRGLLFSSGLVAGEAIMGIFIAVLMVMNCEIPWLKNPYANSFGDEWLGNIVSVIGFALMTLILMRKCFDKDRAVK